MSFNIVTAVWIAKLFVIYTFMVVVLPYFVMRGFLKERSWTQKFVFSVVGGNFFYIMLVLLWGLLHITDRYVLIASTLVLPAVLIIRRRTELWEGHLKGVWIHVCRLSRHEVSVRYIIRIFLRWLGRKTRAGWRKAAPFLRTHLSEMILFAGCSAFIIWYFTITDHFGPREADISVHMSWINEVDNGIIFSDGIYPFGMHALLYYMHAVFGIPTVRIMLLFGPVQTFYIFTMLLAFLKEICRFRYMPYLGYIGFAVGDYLVGGADYGGSFSRYYSALPQEFGMIFLLPCSIALVRFFRAVQDEDRRQKCRESSIWLWLLIISFGLTFSAHFYNTFIAAILVIAAAAAYIRFVVRPEVLKRLICAALLAILIPVFPMAVAFACGTPLQSSLYWGMEIMGIGDEKEAEEATEEAETEEEERLSPDEEGSGETSPAPDQTEAYVPSAGERLTRVKAVIQNMLNLHIFRSETYTVIWELCLLALLAEIPLMWILKEWEYSRYIVMVLINAGVMVLLCIMGDLGLPVLMDMERCPIFFCYTALSVFSLAADGLLLVLGRIIPVQMVWRGASLLLAVLFAGYTLGAGHLKEKNISVSKYQRDGAALCVYDIMEKFPDQKWTIISCNEERNMVSPSAWHYEVIDFLDSMEDYSEDDEMFIPTRYVFFFIEKNCLDYGYGEFTDEDAHVSRDWASEDLPVKNELTQYAGTNRIIVNSRMYYWAQEYEERFPNEMKVYYEDEDFVCYCIEQNEYYLNNFAIDYGYNSGGEAG